MSHKGKEFRSYPAKMEVEAVKYAEINGNRVTGQNYVVDEKRIGKSQKNKNKIVSSMNMKNGQLMKRLQGAGAKPLC